MREVCYTPDKDHYEKCLNTTSEGLKRGPNGYPDGFLRDAIIDCFTVSAEQYENNARTGQMEVLFSALFSSNRGFILF